MVVNNPDPEKSKSKRKTARHMIRVILGAIAVFLIAAFVAYKISPWPSALLIRKAFEKGAEKTSQALQKHVPPGITAIRNLHYNPDDKDAYLDVYFPEAIAKTRKQLPVIVWIHGGGFISGNKDEVANYCKILAAEGYTVVAVDYTIAPAKQYPIPLRQVNAALAYLVKNAKRLHVDVSRFILAGDSAGANIAAQLANLISESSYADLLEMQPAISRVQLAGLLLHCGPYDVGPAALEGDYGKAFRTFLWAYFGRKDFQNAPLFSTIKVVEYVTPTFPPAFISAGNADPLLPYSQNLARKLAKLGVPVDTLFFPANYKPPLPHEYQFNLDSEAGKMALERSVKFLENLRTE